VSRELSLAEIFQLGYYWETKILLTAVKLDIFSALDSKPRSAQEIAGKGTTGEVAPTRVAAWTVVARVVLNLDETITKE